ncbi:MAG TPA: hypothetical protein VFV58_39290 [Blastocatellia bacterium]|jgi:hypothetical protein|nr:hypothetical protein [Blastocatellia bacterium]
MTKLESSSSVIRETAAKHRDRPLIIRLFPRYLEISEKRKRDVYLVAYDVLFDFARKLQFKRGGDGKA